MSPLDQPLDFFDANCMVGPRGTPAPGEYRDADGLLRVMDAHGIAEALVFHSLAKEQSPPDGNRLLLDEIAGHERLHPCAVLLPHWTGEFPPPEEHVPQLLDQGFRAVRLFPANHYFELSSWCCRELFIALAEHRIPLFLDYDNAHWGTTRTNWDAVARAVAAHPTLPVIIVNESMAADRSLQPLLTKFDNFLFETSSYEIHRGLEIVSERHGPQRALFGTGLPSRDPAGPITMITYADLPPDHKALIAGGNLRRLLEGVQTERPRTGIGFEPRPQPRSTSDEWPSVAPRFIAPEEQA